MTESEFDRLVTESIDYMQRVRDECNTEWDFQSYQRFDFSQDDGLLKFSEGPRPDIVCPCQIVGTFITTRRVWRWSWANPSIDDHLKRDLARVQEFGKEHEIDEITHDAWEAEDEEAAWAMTAIAANILKAKSIYRAPNEPLNIYLVVTAVRWADSPPGS